MRNFFIFFVAASIDIFGFLVSFGLAAVTNFGGTIGGCIAGAKVAGAIGCSIAGAFGSLFNPAIAAAAVPLGLIIGNVITFCIDTTFGTGFIVLLIFNGMFSAKDLFTIRRLPNIIIKIIPGLDAIWPGYTVLAWQAISAKRKEESAQRARQAQAVTVEENLEEGEYEEESPPVPQTQRAANDTLGARDIPRSAPVLNDIRFAQPKEAANRNERFQTAA